MKKSELLALLILLFVGNALYGQSPYNKFKMVGTNPVSVPVNQSFSKSTEIFPFDRNENAIYSLDVSANVELKNDESLVRLVLIDANFNEYLIYESYKLLVEEESSFSIDNLCEETSILDKVKPYAISIEIENASLELRSINYATAIPPGLDVASTKKEKKKEQNETKISKINQNLKKQGKHWVAGETSVSELSYGERKKLYGQGTFPAGIEYYTGGVITAGSTESTSSTDGTLKSATTETSSPYVDNWDWRDRHGKDWITSIKNQGTCGSCWAFTATGSTEALVNLFYNQQLNLDLSEQDLISCSNAGNCDGGYYSYALDYITNTGIVDEASFPYSATNETCDNKDAPSSELIKISGKIYTGTSTNPLTEETLKKMLIQFGPLSSGLSSWAHAMVLVGYKVVQVGDQFYSSSYGWITIEPGNTLIGKTVWIFKNSWGTYYGDDGYVYVEVPNMSNMVGTQALKTPILSEINNYEVICEDRDGDGYYWWGLGTKPANCPGPDLADGDDSDPTKGPLDEYGYCMPLNGTTIIPVANFSASKTSLNTNETVSFSDLSTNTPSSWNWTFEGGTPATSTVQNPTVTYNSPGTYNVTLIATNANGSDSETKIDYITVNALLTPPVADFTCSATSIEEKQTVTFTDQSTNSPTSWSWTFEGGTPATSTAQNPTVTYNTPGTYNVSLTATNADGSDSETKIDYIIVNALPTPPVADFTCSAKSIEEKQTITFTDQSTNSPTSWSWTFEGGTPATASTQNPTVTYNTPGTYNVSLTATNADGSDSEIKVDYITVNALPAPPVAEFSADNSAVFIGGKVNFSDLSTNNPDEWFWQFPGGTPSTSTEQNPGITYNTTGTYDVSLTVSNPDGTDTKTIAGFIEVTTQTVNTYPPVASFTYSSSSINEGESITFSDQSTNTPTSWSWTFNGGTPDKSTEKDPTVTYSAAGTYSVSLTVTNDDGSDTKSLSGIITVNELVYAPVADFSSDKIKVNEGESVNFNDNSLNNPASWKWDFEGGNPSTSNERNPKVTYSNANSYKVSLTVTNSAGQDIKVVDNYIQVEKVQREYCTTSPVASEEWISQVTIGANKNTSGAEGYADFTGTIFTLESGTSYSVELIPDFIARSKFEYWAIWIDFDQSMDFSDDEKVFSAAKSKSAVSGSIAIPADIALTTRMRVAMGKSDPTACAYSDMGEVEDYTVQIITPQPKAPVANFTANVYTINAAESVQFSDISENNPTSWEWIFEGGNPATSTNQNPTIAYLASGTYAVTLTVKNDEGENTKSISGLIKVLSENDAAYCTPVNLNSTSNYIKSITLNNTVYESATNNGYSLSNVSIDMNPGQNYTITLIPSLDNSRNFWRIWIDFNQNGVFDDATESVLELSNKKGTVSGNILIPSDANGTTRMRIAMKVGSAPTSCEGGFDGEVEDYEVFFGGAPGSSMMASANPLADIQDEFITVYPNPTEQKAYLKLSIFDDTDYYEVFNATGEKITEEFVTSSINTINLSGQPSGLYFVVVISHGHQYAKKLIKE